MGTRHDIRDYCRARAVAIITEIEEALPVVEAAGERELLRDLKQNLSYARALVEHIDAGHR